MRNLKKKIVAVITAVTLSLGAFCSFSTSMTASAATLGDVNSDSKVDAKDATKILVDYANSLVTKKSSLSTATADVNSDGKIDAKDATKILVYYAASLANTLGGESFATYASHLLCAQGVSIDYINYDTNKSGSSVYSYDLNFKIHNLSKVDKLVQIWYIDANGKEIDCACSIDIKKGATVSGGDDNSDATIQLKTLQEVGITNISKVNYFTLSFHVADYASSDGSFKTPWSNHWDSAKVTLNLK